MHSLANLISNHQTLSVLVAYYILSAAIGAMPAPTATSSTFYQFLFKFSNTIGGNITRAFNTYVESSPNFQPAVNLQQKIAGQEETAVKVPPKVEDKP
jgi:hypothetical protein